MCFSLVLILKLHSSMFKLCTHSSSNKKNNHTHCWLLLSRKLTSNNSDYQKVYCVLGTGSVRPSTLWVTPWEPRLSLTSAKMNWTLSESRRQWRWRREPLRARQAPTSIGTELRCKQGQILIRLATGSLSDLNVVFKKFVKLRNVKGMSM